MHARRAPPNALVLPTGASIGCYRESTFAAEYTS